MSPSAPPWYTLLCCTPYCGLALWIMEVLDHPSWVRERDLMFLLFTGGYDLDQS